MAIAALAPGGGPECWGPSPPFQMPRHGGWHITTGGLAGYGTEQEKWMQAVTEALSDLLAACGAQAILLEAILV